jgi:hypothetical protein
MFKRILPVVIVCLSLFNNTNAQSDTPMSNDEKFHFGFKIAPTYAWILTDSKDWSRDGSNLGFSYGVVTEFAISKNYVFATGVNVTYRGGKVKYQPAIDTSYSAKLKIQYVEIPVTLKMKTNEKNNIKYFGQFGLTPGIKIRAKADPVNVNYPGYSKTEDKVDIMSSVKNFNLNMVIAAGAEYTISGTTALFGSIEFNNGFIDIFRSFDSGVNGNQVYLKGYTNFFALNVGILF